MTSTATENVTKLLDALQGVRSTGDGWAAQCPAHDDGQASLSIAIGDHGGVLLHCHAGCLTPDIVGVLGMTMSDLAPPDFVGGNGHAAHTRKPHIVAAYDYRDEAGELLFQVCRMNPKDFRQRSPAEGGGWTWSTKGVCRVLYRLPELLAADPGAMVYIVEGEKDVDRLAGLGLVATCNVGGGGKWRAKYNEHLRGRKVAIIPDNDQTGQEHAEQVANSLAGTAASVKVVELPNVPEKGDASDFIDQGGTVDELRGLVEAAPAWTPTAKPKAPRREPTMDDSGGEKMTDLGNAKRFVAQHGDSIRYCFPWGKWLAWDGTRWRTDDSGAVKRKGKLTVRKLWQDAADEQDGDKRRDRALFASRSESAPRIQAMIDLAQSEEGVPILPTEMDKDLFLLNCPNGTLDLRTGELRPHRREDCITKLCPTPFEPAAKCPLWESALARIFDGNQAVITHVQRFCGYALTGDVSEQVLQVWHEGGQNGKSTIGTTLLTILGSDYAMKAPQGMLMAKRHESHPTEIADLFRKRLVLAIETNEGNRLNEVLVKELTGGDRIRARHLFQDYWEFTPTHKIILACNHRPAVRGTDFAIWRRMRLVPFTVTIPDNEKDPKLPAKLLDEAPGILAWMVRGCLAWQRDGLGCPAEVSAATESYRNEQDVLAQWMADCCLVDPNASAPARDLYKSYQGYTQDEKTTFTAFGRMLTERGLDKARIRHVVWRLGLGLLTEESEDLP